MIKLYTKPNCPSCIKAKNWLDANGFLYESLDISTSDSLRDFIVSEGHRTVPQIYHESGQVLVRGGFDGLDALEPDELKSKLARMA